MSKLIKWLLGIIAAVLAVVVLGIVIITAFIDPNSFKPDIEKAAGKQGIALTLGGDLAWQFYPDLGIVVEQVAIAPLARPEQAIASVQKAALSVRLLPLFSGKVAVNGVLLDGLDANLVTDADGKGNWEALLANDAAADDTKDEAGQQGDFSLAVHQFSILNSQLIYADTRNQQTVSLRNFVLEGTDIALDNLPFAVHTSGDFVLEDAAKNTQTGKFAVSAGVAVTEDMSAVAIKDGNIVLELAGKDVQQSLKTTLQLAVKLPSDKQALSVDVFELADADITSVDNLAQQNMMVSRLQLKAARISLDEKSLPQLAALEMSAASVTMKNTASQQNIVVQNLVFSASNIAFDAQVFPMVAKGTLQAEQPDMPAISTGFDVSANVGIDHEMNVIMLDKARLLATLQGDAAQSVDLQTSMRVVLDPFTYTGDIHLAPVNARKAMAAIGQTLPATQLPTAFSRVGIQAAVAGSDNAVRLDNLTLVLDESTFSGSLAVTDIARQALVVKLRGDQLNADDYMAPVADTQAAAEAAASGDEPLVPVETLRPLNVDIDLVVDRFTFNKLLFSKLTVMLAAHDGVLDIHRFSGNLYDSPVQLKAGIDARTDKPVITFDASSKQLPVGRLLRDLDIEERFSGTSDVVAKGSSRGISKNELMQGLDAVIDMSGQQMQVAEINIEKTVCEFIAQAEGKKLTLADWENLTRLRDMSTRVTIKNGVANVQNLEAGVEDIALKTHGIFNFIRGDFDFHLTTRIVEALMTGSHCKVTDKKLLNRDIPIRCKGNLDSIGVKTCLPDMSLLEDLAKAKLKEETDAAKAKAQAEVDSAKNKAREKVDQALQEKMGEEGGKAAKELLKGLLKK